MHSEEQFLLQGLMSKEAGEEKIMLYVCFITLILYQIISHVYSLSPECLFHIDIFKILIEIIHNYSLLFQNLTQSISSLEFEMSCGLCQYNTETALLPTCEIFHLVRLECDHVSFFHIQENLNNM